MKNKNYKMPRAFVCNVLLLIEHLRFHYNLDPMAINYMRSLELDIDDKLEAIHKRDVFTAYKSAPVNSSEREFLRQKYLDLASIHKDWCSNNESFL